MTRQRSDPLLYKAFVHPEAFPPNVPTEVRMENFSSDSPNSWDDNGLEIFIDANNNKPTSYDAGDNQIIKNWNKNTVFTKSTLTACNMLGNSKRWIYD